jgi:hypothetical protein
MPSTVKQRGTRMVISLDHAGQQVRKQSTLISPTSPILLRENMQMRRRGVSFWSRAHLKKNVEVTDDQRYLLQPTASSDVLVGNILEDSIGQIIQVRIKMERQTLLHGLSRTSASL